MRVFTILGVVLTVVGLGLVPSSPARLTAPGIDGEVTGMGAGIAALTLLPMGIIFTVVGVATSRVIGCCDSDCSRPASRVRPPSWR